MNVRLFKIIKLYILTQVYIKKKVKKVVQATAHTPLYLPPSLLKCHTKDRKQIMDKSIFDYGKYSKFHFNFLKKFL
jgi:hypothetical protein